MLDRVLATRSLLPEHDLSFLADAPVIFHCHHFNLFLDQTIDDALGVEAGTALRTRAARDASYHLLSSLNRKLGLVTPAERLELAAALFAAMGHGRLEILTQATGGEGRGTWLHYGFAWHEKYGQAVRRRFPADAMAAGFMAAATEVAYGLPRESMQCTETACIAMRAPRCEFTFKPGKAEVPEIDVGTAQARAVVRPSFTGLYEDKIAAIAKGLRDFAGGVAGDERGLVQAFGVFVTLHLSTYYNRISYDAWNLVRERSPASLPVIEALLRESGHVCVFNTFGGILLSPEWEGMVGKIQGDPVEIVSGCTAIGRALGFGHWTLAELKPGERLVLRTPSTYESSYWVTREGPAQQGMCFFVQGAALAFMQLAERVPWTQRPKLTQEFYVELFRRGVPWSVKETKCIAKGDMACEVVVQKT
ncbi:MAG: hypothetical protein IT383_20535 [Deltaproteobacteria bacterium]|nr:hypothetical protein [Deltaproteobacteria bacterium]